jgi:hypothetical protein
MSPKPMPFEHFYFGLNPGDKVIRENGNHRELFTFGEYLVSDDSVTIADEYGNTKYCYPIKLIEGLKDNVIGVLSGNRIHARAYFGE